ncbi:hypothetical protein H311_02773 [Anncaliia algerae PRA109]|nr:hypothetical protein H311_02773 [Anncaliia algerae PRA109]
MFFRNENELFNKLKLHKIFNEECLKNFLETDLKFDELVCTICKRKMWKRKVNIDSVTLKCNFCSKSKKFYHYKNIFNSKLPMHKILYFYCILVFFILETI